MHQVAAIDLDNKYRPLAESESRPSRSGSLSLQATNSPYFCDYLPSLKRAWTDQPNVVLQWTDLRLRRPRVVHGSDNTRSPDTITSILLNVPRKLTSLVSSHRNANEDPSSILSAADGGYVPMSEDGSSASSSGKSPSAAAYTYVLHSQSGLVYPGRLVFVLGGASSGKTTLLQCLSGHAYLTSQKRQIPLEYLSGRVTYNGLTTHEAEEQHGFQVSRYCNLVDQGDVHFSYLTVREVLTFAAANANAELSLLESSVCTGELVALHAQRVDMIIQLLGLEECANTLVGNGSVLLRGISGGQRRRLSLAESLLSGARIICLDQATDGLDAAVAYQLLISLQRWCRLTGTIVITSLLQPSTDLFELADDLIVLREGATMYHGPCTSLAIRSYFTSIHWHLPSDMPILDFLNDLMSLSEPRTTAVRILRAKLIRGTVNMSQESTNLVSELASMPLTTEALAHAFRSSVTSKRMLTYRHRRNMMATSDLQLASVNCLEPDHDDDSLPPDAIPSLQGLDAVSAYTRAQYYSRHPHPSFVHVSLCARRQLILFRRNWLFFIPRMGQAVSVGALLGTLYYQLKLEDFQEKLMLLLFIPVFLAFANISELPWASEALRVVYKQIDNQSYEAWHYIIAVIAIHSILIFLETLVFGSFVYWLAGLYARIDLFLVFITLLLACNYTMSGIFRLIAFCSTNADAAQQVAAPVTAICLLFGGLLITSDQVPKYLLEFFWVSPFSWVLRAMASSEFHSPSYSQLSPDDGSKNIDIGAVFLRIFHIADWTHDFGAGNSLIITCTYLIGVFAVTVIATIWALMRLRVNGRTHTSKANQWVNEELSVELVRRSESSRSIIDISVGNSDGFLQGLSFKPTPVIFRQLSYLLRTTEVSCIERFLSGDRESRKVTQDRFLLRNLSGVFAPGTLTALMGESGAGKTTLLNVLARRVADSGGVTGDVLFGGLRYDVDQPVGALCFGYVEQYNQLLSYQTVREATRFSAELRLSATDRARIDMDTYVNDILAFVSLSDVADHVIGDSTSLLISVGQAKRCCIAIELAANPSVLFCDEPTTGLDNCSALAVVHALKRVSATGRTVVCTIHQPSEEIFEAFDRLYLLQTGGECIYDGPIGQSVNDQADESVPSSDRSSTYLCYAGHTILEYFVIASHNNLASPFNHARRHIGEWMLHNLTLTQRRGHIDYAQIYATSGLHQTNQKQIQQYLDVHVAAAPTKEHFVDDRRSFAHIHAFSCVLRRMFRYYHRDATFHLLRWFLSLLLGLFYGGVYYRVSSASQAAVLAKVSAQFMSMGFTAVLICASTMPITYKLRTIFYAETKLHNSIYYHPAHFTAALALIELPFIVVNSLLAVSPFYLLVGLRASFVSFLQYLLVDVLVSYQFVSWGHLLTAIIPNLTVANIIMGASFSLLFLFGGVPIRASAIPEGFHFLYHTLWLSKGLIATNVLQFECTAINPLDCGSLEILDPLSPSAPPSLVPQSDFVSALLDAKMVMSSYWWQVGMMCITIIALRIGVALAFQKLHYQ